MPGLSICDTPAAYLGGHEIVGTLAGEPPSGFQSQVAGHPFGLFTSNVHDWISSDTIIKFTFID